VGAVMRTCDAVGVRRILASGITPYPSLGADDQRRGPVAARAGRELRKTALNAFDAVQVDYCATAAEAVRRLRLAGAVVVAVENQPRALDIWEAAALSSARLALVFGHERDGVGSDVLALADAVVAVPMSGAGTSLNVAVAAGVVLYEALRRRRSRRVAPRCRQDAGVYTGHDAGDGAL
jgi:tRNA G18 (ribose-2'-O)-methylase SpoU